MSGTNKPSGRRPYERISVLKLPGTGRPVLGESEPVEDDRRTRAATQWGAGHPSPRQQPQATIDTPLPARVQTVLSYRVDPALSEALQGGPSPSPTSRRAAEQVVQATIVLDVGLPEWPSCDERKK
ncbi:MAG TPA: hypothetical protein VL997_11360 [Dyella sp.]|nr:hypothetical protein [Dyella sp.]